jgi:RHS repeat-associated protein
VRGRKDASGLTFLRNRYYDPSTGRFTQQDPIGLAGGLNLYGYAGGDPINFSDPFGLFACKNEKGEKIPCPEPEGGPPVKLPDGKNGKPNSWKPIPGTGERGTKWVPNYPVPSPDGRQPGSSWDPEGHWDVDGLGERRRRYAPDGNEVDHWGNPVTSLQLAPAAGITGQQAAAAAGTAGALLTTYFILRTAGRILVPVTNLVPVP